MIKVPTVLILGAGASTPFGFPSGQTLVDLIVRFFYLAERGYPLPLNAESWFREAMETTKKLLLQEFPKSKVDSFLEHLYDEESIDAFLEYQSDKAVEIGKALIAATLLPFEREHSLDLSFIMNRSEGFFEQPTKRIRAEYNWYQLLWRALASDAQFDKFQENELRIITFNYDRSLEHYLFNRLKRRFHNKTNKEYEAKIPRILHIHGSLGLLPWQTQNGDEEFSAVPYDSIGTFDEWKKEAGDHQSKLELMKADIAMKQWFDVARESITVIPEADEAEDTEELKEARSWIKDYCVRLNFMGFGYHPSNIERLQIGLQWHRKKHIQGTIKGLSKTQQNLFQDILNECSYVTHPEGMFNVTNYEFLHECISLTMG